MNRVGKVAVFIGLLLKIVFAFLEYLKAALTALEKPCPSLLFDSD